MLFGVLWCYKTLEKYVWQSVPGMFKLSVVAYSVVPSKNVFVKEVTRDLTDFFAEENGEKTTFLRYEKKLLTAFFFSAPLLA